MSKKQRFQKKDMSLRGILRDDNNEKNLKSQYKTNNFSGKKKVKFSFDKDSLIELEKELRHELLESSFKQQSEDYKILEADKEFLNIEYAKLNEKYERLGEDYNSLEENNNFLSLKYANLRGEYDELDNNAQNLVNGYDYAVSEFENLKRKHEELEDHFVNTRLELNSEIESLRLKVFILEQTKDKHARENGDLIRNKSNLIRDKGNLIRDKNNLINENNALRNMLNRLRNEDIEEGELQEELRIPKNEFRIPKKQRRF